MSQKTNFSMEQVTNYCFKLIFIYNTGLSYLPSYFKHAIKINQKLTYTKEPY